MFLLAIQVLKAVMDMWTNPSDQPNILTDRVYKPWITLTRYPPFAHTYWLFAAHTHNQSSIFLINKKS